MVIFLGHFVEVLETLIQQRMKVDHIFVEKKKSNAAVVTFCRKHKLRMTIIEKFIDIEANLKPKVKIDLVFCASFGTILRNSFIKKCRYIINYHCADIEQFRGRHPLPTAILNRSSSMALSAHFIDSEKIDAGPFVARITLPINYDQDYHYNEARLRSFLSPITESLLQEYRLAGKLSSWPVKAGAKKNYFKPLDGPVLSRIFSANKLKKV